MENSIAKQKKRTSWEINRVIRNIDPSLTRENIRPISWLTRFTTEKKIGLSKFML
jgi:hypothetical protein